MTDDTTLTERIGNDVWQIRNSYECSEHTIGLMNEAAARITALEAENAALRSELERVLDSVAGLPEALASSERKLADLRTHTSWLGLMEAVDRLNEDARIYREEPYGRRALLRAAENLRRIAAVRQVALVKAPEPDPK